MRQCVKQEATKSITSYQFFVSIKYSLATVCAVCALRSFYCKAYVCGIWEITVANGYSKIELVIQTIYTVFCILKNKVVAAVKKR